MKASSSSNVLIGRKPIYEALLRQHAIDKIYLQNNIHGELIGDVLKLAKQAGIPVVRVPLAKLQSYTKLNHQGMVALAALVTYNKLQPVIDMLYEQGATPAMLWLDGITDVRNIGAIARTAKCFDIHAIILTEKGSAPINDEAVKASAGAVLDITIVREKSAHQVIEILQANGIAIYASSLQASLPVQQLNFNTPFALVLGAEEVGISKQVADASTTQFIIPMSTSFDSLNVSVAAGIMCHCYYTSQHMLDK
jgi:23S rRNA (guanosine2251-2'-O)-methyltransferase